MPSLRGLHLFEAMRHPGDRGHPATGSEREGREPFTAWPRRPLPYALARTRALAADARHDPSARRALREAVARLPPPRTPAARCPRAWSGEPAPWRDPRRFGVTATATLHRRD